jgi:flagellar motility protein MotE (MotC chaperone)
MSPEFAAGFLGRMQPEAAAAVLSGMSAEAAYAVSILIAGRNARAPDR